MIAAIVRPQRRSSDARCDTHRATGIDENDRQAGAGRPALLDGLSRTLVGPLAAGVVVDVDEVKDLAVERLRRLGGGRCLGHDVAAFLVKVRPPTLARLVEAGVRQHIVEKQLLGQPGAPRELLARLHRQVEVLGEKLAIERREVARRHALDEELGGTLAKVAVCFFGCGNECLELGAIVTGLGQGGIERLARLAKRNGTRQQAGGKKKFHPCQKLCRHERELTRLPGQDQRLGESMTGGVGAVAGEGSGRA